MDASCQQIIEELRRLVDLWADQMAPMARLPAQRFLVSRLDALRDRMIQGVDEPFVMMLVRNLGRATWRLYDKRHGSRIAA